VDGRVGVDGRVSVSTFSPRSEKLFSYILASDYHRNMPSKTLYYRKTEVGAGFVMYDIFLKTSNVGVQCSSQDQNTWNTLKDHK
jgi:hypothetical protein